MEKDREILTGLQTGPKDRASWELQFYRRYEYFIGQGCRKYRLSSDDSFSAYSDAVLSAIHNIAMESHGLILRTADPHAHHCNCQQHKCLLHLVYLLFSVLCSVHQVGFFMSPRLSGIFGCAE